MSDDNFQKLDQTLKSINDRLGGVEKQLNDPETGLPGLNQKVDSISKKVDDPETGLTALNQKVDSISKKVDDPETGLPGLNAKADSTLAELHDVHDLAKGIYDLVKLEQEKRKEDTTQIRQFVGMPTID